MKTPRMVKQASKKNSKVKRNGSGEEDSESLEVRIRSFFEATFLLDPPTCHGPMLLQKSTDHKNTQLVIG